MDNMPIPTILKSREVSGKPVISLQGEEVGAVARLVVDPALAKVVGVTVNVKGWFKGEKCLEFQSVESFGDYALTVRQSDHVVPLNTLPAIERLAQEYNIYNMRIISPEGKLIGTVDDFYFNTGSGQIERFILTGGIIKNLFKGRASIPSDSIQTIGKDVIVATPDVEETIQKEEGGIQENLENLKEDLEQWKGDLEHWKDDFEKIWDKTRTKTLELSKTLGENLKVAAKSSTGTGKKFLSTTGRVLSEKTAQLKSSYDFWLDRLQAVKNGVEKPLDDEDIKTIVGLKAGETVTDDSGKIIIAENQAVTPETIDEANKAGKTKELLISLATRDLQDQIEAIEKENE